MCVKPFLLVINTNLSVLPPLHNAWYQIEFQSLLAWHKIDFSEKDKILFMKII